MSSIVSGILENTAPTGNFLACTAAVYSAMFASVPGGNGCPCASTAVTNELENGFCTVSPSLVKSALMLLALSLILLLIWSRVVAPDNIIVKSSDSLTDTR